MKTGIAIGFALFVVFWFGYYLGITAPSSNDRILMSQTTNPRIIIVGTRNPPLKNEKWMINHFGDANAIWFKTDEEADDFIAKAEGLLTGQTP